MTSWLIWRSRRCRRSSSCSMGLSSGNSYGAVRISLSASERQNSSCVATVSRAASVLSPPPSPSFQPPTHCRARRHHAATTGTGRQTGDQEAAEPPHIQRPPPAFQKLRPDRLGAGMTHLGDLFVFAVHGGAQIDWEMLEAVRGAGQGTSRLQRPGAPPHLCRHRQRVSPRGGSGGRGGSAAPPQPPGIRIPQHRGTQRQRHLPPPPRSP